MSSLSRKKFGEGYLFTFLVCIITAAVLYTPFLIIDKGLFQYCGDFNSQQIPFYTYMNGFVKTAEGQWSWNTDLGTSAVNGYSFYLLGSPFFWLSTLLPQSAVPYAMVPLLVLKFGVCGLAAYTYLHRYAKTRQAAVVASVLYAFSGFTVYNTFFNHFLDCIALFPLLLWALDEAVLENRRALLPVLLAVNLVNNYFFFAGQAVFLVVYFVWKVARGEYRLRTGLFFRLAFETVLGCAMGCVLLVPAVSFLLGNPRTVDPSSGFGFLIYGRPQQYFAILTSLFLPPDPTYLPNIFTDCVIKHTSMTAYLPVVGAAGVFAYMGARKKSANTAILWTCLIMALVPVLNSSFYALNSSYYARWYYMPVLIMCAATMHALEDADIDLMRGIRPVAAVTAVYLVFAFVPKEEDGVWSFGVVQEPAQFWLIWLTAVLGILLFFGIVKYLRFTPKFYAALLAAILPFSVFYSVCHIGMGKFPQWENDADYRRQMFEAAPGIAWPEDDFYRVDSYECQDNLTLMMEKPCLQFFNSTVTPSIMEFYPLVGVKRDVSSKPEQDLYALRGLLGVRYIMMPLDKADAFEEECGQWGYTRAFSDETFAFYKNGNALPMGFAYDAYVTMEELEKTEESKRGNVLVRAVALTDEQAEKYGGLLRHLTDAERAGNSYEQYVQDAAARRAMGVTRFEEDASGFEADIRLESSTLVFFSVPWDEGWSATVNGQPVQVEKVSGGMCAVVCPAGESTVQFHYQTPGFALGRAVSLSACGVWAVYAGAALFFRHKRKKEKQQWQNILRQ